MKTLTNNSTMKYLVLFFAAGVTALSSCKKDDKVDNTTPTQAAIMITNALEGSAAQDLYLGNTKVTTSAVAYGQTSNYITYDPGTRSAKFTNTGSTTANVQFDLALSAGQYYSVFYTGGATASSSSYLVLSDAERVNTIADKARVRFVNLANNLASGVDFGLSATSKLVTDLAYKTASAYQTVDANSQLNLFITGSTSILLPIPTTLRAGRVYTIYVSGNSATTLSYHVITQN